MESERTIAILKRARQLLQRGWSQGNYAKDRTNMPISVTDELAVDFCLVGAIIRSIWELNRQSVDAAYWAKEQVIAQVTNVATRQFVIGGLIAFNDSPDRTQEDVLRVMDQAILEAGGGK